MSDVPRHPSAGRRSLARAGRAILDQVLSSGTGLLLLVLVARSDDATTLGALSVALIVNGFVLGLGRAAVGEVTLMRCRSEPADPRREAEIGMHLSLGLGTTAGVLLLVTAAGVGGETGRFLGLIAVAAPFVAAQDVLRYVAYGSGRVDRAIAIDALWLGVQGGASAALLIADEATPMRLVVAWGGGAAAAAVVGCLLQRVRPRRAGLRGWWHDERSRSTSFLGDFVVSTGMVQASFVVLSLLLPLDEFGALRVAFVSLSPLANLLAGVRTMTLASLAGLQEDPARAERRAARLAVAFAGAGAAYGTFLVIVPDDLAAELFGQTWAEASGLVGIVAVGEALRLSTFAAIDLVKVLGRPMDLVRTRTVAGVGVVAGLLGGAAIGGPRGAAVCMAAGYALAAAMWWRRARLVASVHPGAAVATLPPPTVTP